MFLLMEQQRLNISQEFLLALETNVSATPRIEWHESIYLSCCAVGLLLNLALFVVINGPGRRLSSTRSHYVFISVLTLAHIMFCLAHIGEFAIAYLSTLKLFDKSQAWLMCSRAVQSRGVRWLWHLLALGAVLGCAVDSYVTICKPIWHRTDNKLITIIFITATVIYCFSAVAVTFFDFFSSANFITDCPFTDASVENAHAYCRRIYECHRSLNENIVFFAWLLSAVACLILYAKVILTLRASQVHNSLTSSAERPSLGLACSNDPETRTSRTSSRAKKNKLLRKSRSLSALPRHSWITTISLYSNRQISHSKASIASTLSHNDRIALMLKQRRNLSNSFIAVAVLFIITWLPDMLLQFLNEFFFTLEFRLTTMPKIIRYVSYFRFLIMINTVIDPIIYGRFFIGFLWKKTTDRRQKQSQRQQRDARKTIAEERF